jgi:hypothetical protein
MSPYSKRKMKLVENGTNTENGNFCLFAANGNRKWQPSVGLLQTETETEVCLPWSANEKR